MNEIELLTKIGIASSIGFALVIWALMMIGRHLGKIREHLAASRYDLAAIRKLMEK